jgi:hypothetical protein
MADTARSLNLQYGGCAGSLDCNIEVFLNLNKKAVLLNKTVILNLNEMAVL